MKTLARALFPSVALLLGGCASVSSLFGNAGADRPSPPPPAPQTMAAATISPKDEMSLYLNVINGLIQQQHYGAALAFLDDYALRQKSPTPRYWKLRGDALLGSDRGTEASLAYAQLDSTPLAAEGWNGQGRVAAASQQWRIARGDFQKAAQAEPSNADFLNNLAYAGMHLGQGASSAAQLRQAHELNPSSSLIRNNLVVALDMSGDKTGAEKILHEIAGTDEREEVRRFALQAVATYQPGGQS